MEKYDKTTLRSIAARFDVKAGVSAVEPLGEGFINDTFTVKVEGSDRPAYLLQRKNKKIFTDVPAMMNNILLVTTHLKKKIAAAGGDPSRESLTVTPLPDGSLCYMDGEGEYWAMCDYINDTVTHQVADTPYLAGQGGYGVGKFQAMLADMTDPLADILPGFHNMKFRFAQWDETLAKDPAGRKKSVEKEIGWVEQRRAQMVAFWELYESGVLPRRVTHNDSKITNMLFNREDRVMCVIDLDTVMNSMCLNDFGDVMRSYTNTGAEDDPDLGRVSMSMEIFEACTKGYLSQAASFLTEAEVDNLAFSGLYITYEQVLRFLMDYIDGDNYYKVKSPDHNLIRTRAQYKLLQSMESQYDRMRGVVAGEMGRLKTTKK